MWKSSCKLLITADGIWRFCEHCSADYEKVRLQAWSLEILMLKPEQSIFSGRLHPTLLFQKAEVKFNRMRLYRNRRRRIIVTDGCGYQRRLRKKLKKEEPWLKRISCNTANNILTMIIFRVRKMVCRIPWQLWMVFWQGCVPEMACLTLRFMGWDICMRQSW